MQCINRTSTEHFICDAKCEAMDRGRRKGVNANAREVEILTVVGNGIKIV